MAKEKVAPASGGVAPAASGLVAVPPNYEKWVADYKGTVESLGDSAKPSSGVVAAVAALRHVRGLLLDEVKVDDTSAEAIFFRDTVKNALNSRIKAIVAKGSVDDGWLSNASAAAKAAGFKVDGTVLNQIDE